MTEFRYGFSYPPDFNYSDVPSIWQNPDECLLTLALMRSFSIKTVLEIGVGHGLMLDVYEEMRIEYFGIDKEPKREHERIKVGHSGDPEVIKWALKKAPYDAVILDGDHEGRGILADFTTYLKMAKKFVIIHDILSNQSPPFPTDVGVRDFWNFIKTIFLTMEITSHINKSYGVGILIKSSVVREGYV